MGLTEPPIIQVLSRVYSYGKQLEKPRTDENTVTLPSTNEKPLKARQKLVITDQGLWTVPSNKDKNKYENRNTKSVYFLL